MAVTIDNLWRNGARLPRGCLAWDWERLCTEINLTLGAWADSKGLTDRVYQGGTKRMWSESTW